MTGYLNRAGRMAGVATFAAALLGAGAGQAAVVLSANGLAVSLDANNFLATAPFSVSQSTPFSNVESNLFSQSGPRDPSNPQFTQHPRTNSSADARVSADFNSVAVETGAQILRIAGDNEKGTTTVAGFAQSSFQDELTVSGSANSPQQVILHRTLELIADLGASAVDEAHGAHTEGAARISLLTNFTTDLGSGDVASLTFASVNQNVDRQSLDRIDRLIDLTLVVDLNHLTDVSLGLLNQFDFHLTDVDGEGFANGGNLAGGILARGLARFVGDATVTDASGASVCGLTITAASGQNWGSTAACQGGGGGGGAVGVPEPASWALMIAGFGAVGAAIRRRRAGEPA